MFELTNTIRTYSWGSRSHIPRLLGDEPSEETAAELWIGAHEGDPSKLPDGSSLIDAIAADPAGMLGERVATAYHNRLPFLAKLLAAAEPLSLQVHPTSERAQCGYAAEQDQGLPIDAPHRSYKDSWHKPELIFALTRFEGMAGFRDVANSVEILRLLQLPWLDEIADDLETGEPGEALRRVVTAILTTQQDALAERLAELALAAEAAEARSHRIDPRMRPPETDRASVARESVRVFAQTVQLARRYPDDPGVLVTLLLNHVVLAPGEAMFLDAGVIHAYTSGFGVEVMAASDNVLRAGLTPKHVDIPELLAITDFRPMAAPLCTPDVLPDTAAFHPPVTEFALSVGTPPGDDLPTEGPRVVVALEGPLTVHAKTEDISLSDGRAAWVAHADGPIRLTGEGRFAVVSVP